MAPGQLSSILLMRRPGTRFISWAQTTNRPSSSISNPKTSLTLWEELQLKLNMDPILTRKMVLGLAMLNVRDLSRSKRRKRRWDVKKRKRDRRLWGREPQSQSIPKGREVIQISCQLKRAIAIKKVTVSSMARWKVKLLSSSPVRRCISGTLQAINLKMLWSNISGELRLDQAEGRLAVM